MRRSLVAVALCATVGAALAGDAPLERTIVQAVPDATLDRILVRWTTVDGGAPRFTHYDVMRRESDESVAQRINDDPIGALQSVAEIEALFQRPGFGDALADAVASLGPSYAGELLRLRQPGAPSVDRLRLQLLPDFDYGVAIALGLGLMDEGVVAGHTYVYEVWGLDALGFRQERLGRAVATAGAPDAPLPADAECAELVDERANMRTFVRWSSGVAAEKRYVPGYDLYRVPADSGGQCTSPNGPGAPGAVKVNAFPTQRVPVGHVAEGRDLFAAHCASCHGAADPRNVPPPSGVKFGTIATFERRKDPALWPNPIDAAHDTLDLQALGPETVRAVFDWIQEFHYVDDGHDTPAVPLVEGQTYCYSVLARDLLGQHGSAGAQAACAALDRDPPQVPWSVAVQRVTLVGPREVCEVSWARNADAGDDTVEYRVFRMSPDPPRASSDPSRRVFAPDPAVDVPLATLAQPPSGDRMSYLDASIGTSDAGERFYYAVAAVDDAGQASAFSGWSPCVPRDIVGPFPPVVSLECCDPAPNTGCIDLRADTLWNQLGGEPDLFWDTTAGGNCIRVSATQPGDTFGLRLYRSFDGTSFLEGRDFKAGTDETFAPSVDAKVYARVRGFDKSGNFSAPSNSRAWFAIAPPLPAPRIVDVTAVASPTLTGLIKIRFRSLPWTNLLGFALYKHTLEPEEPIPADRGSFVVRYHDANLSATEYQPGWWAPQSGAQPLSALLTTGPPTAADEFLYYDVVKDLYVMQVDVGDREGLVLNLMAIGWSGREGQYESYRWEGTPHDGLLEWPTFRVDNHAAFKLGDDLTATYVPALNRVDLTWTAQPQGCVDDKSRPFIVFRRRGSATRWEQISPPFGCATGPALEFHDHDVEPLPDGSPRRHHYTVIRLGAAGEFLGQYGPVFADVP